MRGELPHRAAWFTRRVFLNRLSLIVGRWLSGSLYVHSGFATKAAVRPSWKGAYWSRGVLSDEGDGLGVHVALGVAVTTGVGGIEQPDRASALATAPPARRLNAFRRDTRRGDGVLGADAASCSSIADRLPTCLGDISPLHCRTCAKRLPRDRPTRAQ
jgi:hypothetical protein